MYQESALPVVPEFYMRATVAIGHTGQYLSKTCGNDSVSMLQKSWYKKKEWIV
jgi:hypothetical protein